jgi:hypothetical protein
MLLAPTFYQITLYPFTFDNRIAKWLYAAVFIFDKDGKEREVCFGSLIHTLQ